MKFVYVLWSEKLSKRYIGSTKDFEKRLLEHNKGRTPFTKSGVPWQLVHLETFDEGVSTRKRELFLKSGVGRKWLNELLPTLKKTK